MDTGLVGEGTPSSDVVVAEETKESEREESDEGRVSKTRRKERNRSRAAELSEEVEKDIAKARECSTHKGI